MKKLVLVLISCVFIGTGATDLSKALLLAASEKENAASAKEKATSAQEAPDTQSDTFEGEIAFETFESYSEYINKMPNSIYVDGVHKMRLIVKGNKMHLIDETLKCHIVATDTYTHYCDFTKTGFCLLQYDFMMAAAPRTLNYGYGQVAKLLSNSFAKTEVADSLLGQKCILWQGDVIHEMGGKPQKYSCHAYCTDIKAPASYSVHLYGMPLETIAAKWIIKYDGGHESVLNVGELSYYAEGDVISITPRPVSDDEFALPAGYKIAKGDLRNAMKMMQYYTGVKKALEKAGIKGEDKTAKSTGVHYKTQEEWDF